MHGLFRLEARGVENLPDGGFVLAANHTSNFDPWPLGWPLWPERQLHFMAKAELFNPILGPPLRDGFEYRIVEPASGPLASGQSGVGRLAELPDIVNAVVAAVDGRPIRQPDPAARPPLDPLHPTGRILSRAGVLSSQFVTV